MGFLEANYTTFIKKYATFSGRASRSEFWWFRLSYLILTRLLAWGIPKLLETSWGSMVYLAPIHFYILFMCIDLVILVPFLSVASRRLHDRDMSGFWSIIILIQAILPYYELFAEPDPLPFKTLNGLCIIAVIILQIILMFQGTMGANKYGPDPLRPNTNTDVFA
ncbi:DUF805 domain-containing protein [Bartonella sp. HY329]|uniref:DUF805 domain-containing protein n=1 Tax=unclassified Bartonella TaxID=2645622 RepID=UPI0021C699B2|nr:MULTISPECIES: DUF805 domain-containing protein [unclassified Bartonella]UXM96006.1 DUF805 domain-containing protein [Bartonella sp. HY329]UXN10331.1 DUF805 domain-containing protein [Bartonella sp. HY328]